MKRIPAKIVCWGVVTLLASGCSFYPSVWQEQRLGVEPAAGDWNALRVETRNGSVSVTGSHDGALAVNVLIKGGGVDQEDAEQALAAIQVDSKIEGGAYKLGWSWKQEPEKYWGGSVSFEVVMPADRAVHVISRNGKMAVSDVDSSVDLDTRNGAVTVKNIQGSVRIASRNGKLSLTGVNGDVVAHTRNGAIQADAVGGAVDLQTRNGAIRATLDNPRVSGTIITRNGSVKLRLPETASAAVDVTSRNGKVHVARATHTETSERNRFVGTLGDGDGHLKIETRNGSVSVE
ncbi:MAG: DUF4097 family beta strand repeat-containing protein [Planctomycetota bacterium]